MLEAPEQIKKEDKIYREMKSTLDDATLLSEYVDDIADDEEYMKVCITSFYYLFMYVCILFGFI